MGNRPSAAEDAQHFRDGYPGQEEEEDPADQKNVQFYSNTLASSPDGALVEVIHDTWWGALAKLEVHHGYIQWLFPIRAHGMNAEAQPLTLLEAQTIRADPAMRGRVLRSFQLYMDFAGYAVDPATTAFTRTPEFAPRMANINTRSHNYLRITRIIKCLQELGLEKFVGPMLTTFLEDAFVNKSLRDAADSIVNYWIPVVRDDVLREALLARAKELSPSHFEEQEVGPGARQGGSSYPVWTDGDRAEADRLASDDSRNEWGPESADDDVNNEPSPTNGSASPVPPSSPAP